MDLKKAGKSIGFVPTMGALHSGHLALLERAKNECDIAVVSIFVNPLQFNDKKDLDKYPRTLEGDSELLWKAGCDVLFAPSVEEMYPPGKDPGNQQLIDLGNLDKVMEGLHRPGHFQGVCVVVKKLFDIVEPHKAYFGEKDFQQLAVIKHMVKQLNLPVNIIPYPTVREKDGLAMSSRNALLTAPQRKAAPSIYASLLKAKEEWNAGMVEGWKERMKERIDSDPVLELEYFEIANALTLEPVTGKPATGAPLRACIAVKAGSVRLIDNIAF